jgi:hypothetical protein
MDFAGVTTFTPNGVRHHLRAARRAGIPFIPQCDVCNSRLGVALFAAAYRHWRIERCFSDPENLRPNASRSDVG